MTGNSKRVRGRQPIYDTADNRRKIREWLVEGVSISEIARFLKCSAQAVRLIADKHSMPRWQLSSTEAARVYARPAAERKQKEKPVEILPCPALMAEAVAKLRREGDMVWLTNRGWRLNGCAVDEATVQRRADALRPRNRMIIVKKEA